LEHYRTQLFSIAIISNEMWWIT